VIADEYVAEIQVKLLSSPAIDSFKVVKTRVTADGGYFRARLTLRNGDFLEIAEFFVVRSQVCRTETYRYQWMDQTQKQLRKRWDNVEHFPDLSNFPHHVHVLEEENVLPSRSFSIVEIIEQVEREIGL
jgi:Family of unknown function (DUF6516)